MLLVAFCSCFAFGATQYEQKKAEVPPQFMDGKAGWAQERSVDRLKQSKTSAVPFPLGLVSPCFMQRTMQTSLFGRGRNVLHTATQGSVFVPPSRVHLAIVTGKVAVFVCGHRGAQSPVAKDFMLPPPPPPAD